MSARIDLPLIPLGGWRTKAACTERVTEMLWDDRVEHESDKQRLERHRQAKEICLGCTVRTKCSDEADWSTDEGIRGGHKLPSLDSQRTPAESEMLRLLRKGWSLDQAAGLTAGLVPTPRENTA